MEDLAQRLSSILSDEKSMKQIEELASMLALPADSTPPASQPEAKGQPGEGSPDISGLISLAKGLEGSIEEDENIRLIRALRPLLGEARRKRADSAVRLLKMINLLPLITKSGLLGGDGLGIL